MAEFLKLNGTPVRTTGLYQRQVPQVDGPDLAELELVIIVRGTMANRSLKQLLSTEHVRVDLTNGNHTENFDSLIESVAVNSSGTGEAAAHRFDLTLRETPDSAMARADYDWAEKRAIPKERTGPARYSAVTPIDDSPDEPLDFSKVSVGGDSSVWATALKQMTTPKNLPPEAFPDAPFSPLEQASVDSKLLMLKMEALIDQLEVAGRVRRVDVDIAYLTLVAERFVNDVKPFVGEEVANRAAREVLE